MFRRRLRAQLADRRDGAIRCAAGYAAGRFQRPSTELPQTDAFVEVDAIALARRVKRIFSRWMFAARADVSGAGRDTAPAN
jgi:hypothetical protein